MPTCVLLTSFAECHREKMKDKWRVISETARTQEDKIGEFGETVIA